MFRENHHPMSFWMEKKVHIWNFPVWSITLPTLTISPPVENMDMSGRSLLVTLDPDATTETAGSPQYRPVPILERRYNKKMTPYLVGGWATPLKNISQMGLLFPIYGKIKHIPNHQPDTIWVAK